MSAISEFSSTDHSGEPLKFSAVFRYLIVELVFDAAERLMRHQIEVVQGCELVQEVIDSIGNHPSEQRQASKAWCQAFADLKAGPAIEDDADVSLLIDSHWKIKSSCVAEVLRIASSACRQPLTMSNVSIPIKKAFEILIGNIRRSDSGV